MYVLNKSPLKRNDHNSCSLSFIWYYLSSCQDCGVFQIWKDLVKQGDSDGAQMKDSHKGKKHLDRIGMDS